MTNRILSGTYASGYTLSAAFTGVSVTPTGSITNVTGTLGSSGYNAGSGGATGSALSLGTANGTLINRGQIKGGTGGAGGYEVSYYNQFAGRQYVGAYGNGAAGGDGVTLAGAGRVTNFATITGGAGGAGGASNYVGGGAGGSGGTGVVCAGVSTITNDGLIMGGAAGSGGFGSLYHGTAGRGGIGIYLQAGGVVVNLGTVAGGAQQSTHGYKFGSGIGLIDISGAINNGDASHTSAVISGRIGVEINSGTLVNFGTITDNNYGYFGSSVIADTATVLIAEGGSDFVGIIHDGGTVELRAGATGTVDGIDSGNVGKVIFSNGASWVFGGESVIPTGLTVRPGGTLALDGILQTHGLIAGRLTVTGDLRVDGGKVLSLVGGNLTNLSDGTLAGGIFHVGASTDDPGGISGILQLANNAAITTLDATIVLEGNSTIRSLDTATGNQVSLRSSLTHIGGVGVLEVTDQATFSTFNSIINNGTIEALGGTVSIAGAVSGSGLVEIGAGGTATVTAGSATITGAFAENVTFTAGKGELALGKSQGYTGTISGFSKTGADTLDLRDIGFKAGTTKATYSGTASGGVLTVTDGKHTANINLAGNFLSSTWTVASDGHGGTTVVDGAHSAPSAAPLASAMAGFGAGNVATTQSSSQAWMSAPPMLAAAHPG